MSWGAFPSWAVRGRKIVCVDAEWLDIAGTPTVLAVGAIYTIDGFEEDSVYWACPMGAVFLKEVANPTDASCGFGLDRFRPLVSTKTEAEDVARFRKLLTQRIPEDA
jgi:hypothetical protein